MKNNRNIIFSFLALLFVSVACTDNSEDYLFKDNPNARFEKLKKDYVNTLTSAENGWIGYYAPNDKVGSYVLLMKFDKDGNVTMSSDYNQGGNDNTSTYRIDKKLKVQLVLETHAVLHQIYETNQNGVQGEYVFNILSVTDDTVELESATDFGYGGSSVTKLTLKKATAEQWNLDKVYKVLDGLNAGDADFINFMDYSKKRIYVKDTNVSKTFKFIFDTLGAEINRYAEITTVDADGNEIIEKMPVFVTYDGFSFVKPYKMNEVEVKDFTFDEATKTYTSQDGGQTTIVENTTAPIEENKEIFKQIEGKLYELSYVSSKFNNDYAVPFLKAVPGYKWSIITNNYNGWLSGIVVNNGANNFFKFSFDNTQVRADVVKFNYVESNGIFSKESFSKNPAILKYMLFFVDEKQDFFIESKDGGNSFVLYDRDNPEYFIAFRR